MRTVRYLKVAERGANLVLLGSRTKRTDARFENYFLSLGMHIFLSANFAKWFFSLLRTPANFVKYDRLHATVSGPQLKATARPPSLTKYVQRVEPAASGPVARRRWNA